MHEFVHLFVVNCRRRLSDDEDPYFKYASCVINWLRKCL